MTIWAVPMCYFTLLTNPKKIALEFPFKNLHELPLNVRPKHTCKSLKATIFTNIQYKWDNLRNTHFIIQSKFYINSIKKMKRKKETNMNTYWVLKAHTCLWEILCTSFLTKICILLLTASSLFWCSLSLTLVDTLFHCTNYKLWCHWDFQFERV